LKTLKKDLNENDALMKSQKYDGKIKSSSSRRANHEEYRASGSREACVDGLLRNDE
jgi:hypothetical protein